MCTMIATGMHAHVYVSFIHYIAITTNEANHFSFHYPRFISKPAGLKAKSFHPKNHRSSFTKKTT